MRFSPSTLGWYPESIKYQSPPADLIEVSEAMYQSLQGKQIEVATDGLPREYTPPAPAHADLVVRALTETRAQRQPIISVLDGLQSSALALGDTAAAVAIETAKDGLRDLTLIDLSACVTYEDMRLAVKARYLAIAMAAPDSVRKAFSEALK